MAIENVWGHRQRNFKENNPRNMAPIIKEVLEISIECLYRSSPARFAAVKKFRGHITWLLNDISALEGCLGIAEM